MDQVLEMWGKQVCEGVAGGTSGSEILINQPAGLRMEGAPFLSAASLPVIFSQPKISRTALCHPPGSKEKGASEMGAPCIQAKRAFIETATILYFCEMVLIILHVYFAHFAGIQGKIFLGFRMFKRKQYCTEHSIVIFFLKNHVQTLNVIYMVVLFFLYAVFMEVF